MRAKSIALIEHRVTAVVAETSADDDDTRIERVLIEIIEEDDPAPEGSSPTWRMEGSLSMCLNLAQQN